MTELLKLILSGDQKELSLWHSFLALGVAYFGGVLASLTPCVYPMIPITVSVIGGMGADRKSWKEVYLRGLAYVAGMTVIYSFLGVLAGVSGRVFGSFTNNSNWYLWLGIIMTLAALIMLDAIPFDPAVWWQQIQSKVKQRVYPPKHPKHSHPHPSQPKEVTRLGAFFLGASSGFIAAPCTTPVLTSILAFIAKTQSVGLGFFLMLFFSLGLGTLLLLIATFTGAVQLLPRSGQWMKTVKVGSGLILLAFGEYLIYRSGSSGGP